MYMHVKGNIFKSKHVLTDKAREKTFYDQLEAKNKGVTIRPVCRTPGSRSCRASIPTPPL
ncbi:hypothetical protein Bca4012_058881 [Brassica carinata]